jgi:hypothetical protein
LTYVRNNGAKPRYRGNRLIFLAPDHGALSRFRDCIRVALAWNSIVDDVAGMRLTLDNLQAAQAKNELRSAEEVLPRVARECFKWLLCPSQGDPTGKPDLEAAQLNTSGSALGAEIERVCMDNEWVIAAWSPIHLRAKLKEFYWKPEKPAEKAVQFWEDTLRYLYLPRLKNRDVMGQAIVKGAATSDFFGTAYGEYEGKFDGFRLGDPNVQFDDTLLLIAPEVAKVYATSTLPITPASPAETPLTSPGSPPPPTSPAEPLKPVAPAAPPVSLSHSFHGSVSIAPAAAKMRLVQIAEEIINALTADPNAEVNVRVEIAATFPNGAQDQTRRAVSENAKTLGFGTAEWE